MIAFGDRRKGARRHVGCRRRNGDDTTTSGVSGGVARLVDGVESHDLGRRPFFRSSLTRCEATCRIRSSTLWSSIYPCFEGGFLARLSLHPCLGCQGRDVADLAGDAREPRTAHLSCPSSALSCSHVNSMLKLLVDRIGPSCLKVHEPSRLPEQKMINGNQIWYLLVGRSDWRGQGLSWSAQSGSAGDRWALACTAGNKRPGGQRVPKRSWTSSVWSRRGARAGKMPHSVAVRASRRDLSVPCCRTYTGQWHELPGRGPGRFPRFHLPQESSPPLCLSYCVCRVPGSQL